MHCFYINCSSIHLGGLTQLTLCTILQIHFLVHTNVEIHPKHIPGIKYTCSNGLFYIRSHLLFTSHPETTFIPKPIKLSYNKTIRKREKGSNNPFIKCSNWLKANAKDIYCFLGSMPHQMKQADTNKYDIQNKQQQESAASFVRSAKERK